METTFDLRNGKTLNKKKVISFDGTLSESFLKPLFHIYDKYKVGIGIKGKSGKFKEKIRYINYFDNKTKLTNKRSVLY
jgi:hypothetical protein